MCAVTVGSSNFSGDRAIMKLNIKFKIKLEALAGQTWLDLHNLALQSQTYSQHIPKKHQQTLTLPVINPPHTLNLTPKHPYVPPKYPPNTLTYGPHTLNTPTKHCKIFPGTKDPVHW